MLEETPRTEIKRETECKFYELSLGVATKHNANIISGDGRTMSPHPKRADCFVLGQVCCFVCECVLGCLFGTVRRMQP